MNGTLLFFMALAWLIGFIHGWFGRGYHLKHKMYYDRVDEELHQVPAFRVPDLPNDTRHELE